MPGRVELTTSEDCVQILPHRFNEYPPEVRNMIYRKLFKTMSYGRMTTFVSPSIMYRWDLPTKVRDVDIEDSRHLYPILRLPHTGWIYQKAAMTKELPKQHNIIRFFLSDPTTHAEAESIYFGEFTFVFDRTEDFTDYIDSLQPRQRQMLRKIKFDFTGKAPATAAKKLCSLPSLEKLRLTIHPSVQAKKKDDGKLYVAGLDQLLKIRGVKKLEVKFNSMINDRVQDWYESSRVEQDIVKARLRVLKDAAE